MASPNGASHAVSSPRSPNIDSRLEARMKRAWSFVLVIAALALSGTSQAARRRAVRSPEAAVARFSANAFMTAAQHPALNLTSAMTLEAWIYQTDDHSQNTATILRREDANGGWEFVLRLVPPAGGGTERLFFQVHDGSGQHMRLTGTSAIPRSEWVHVACSVDSSRGRCWLDGVSQGSFVVNGFPRLTSATGPLIISSDGDGFAGVVRDVRVWSRVVPQAELQQIAGGKPPLSADGLVAHWPMRDGNGQIARDLGPNQISLFRGNTEQFEAFEPTWADMDVLETGPYFEIRHLPPSTVPSAELITMDMTGDGFPDVTGIGGPAGKPGCAYPYFPAQQQSSVGYRSSSGGSSFETATLVDWETFGLVWKRYTADFTGDGKDDVFLAATGPEVAFYGVDCPPDGPGPEDAPGGQARILVAGAGGKLREETSTRLPARVAYDYGTAIGDFDRDRDLDILLLRPIDDPDPCRPEALRPDAPCPVMLLNDGRGFFTADFTRLPAAVQRGLDEKGVRKTYWTAAATDIDRDGDDDILLGSAYDSVRAQPVIHLLVNDGSGRFAIEKGAFPDIPFIEGPYPGPEWMVTSDFDRDGNVDVFAAMGTRGESRLYLNNGNHTFRERSENLPPGLRDYGAARCEGADMNGDGTTDVVCMVRYTGEPYAVVLGPGPAIFYNRGDATFEMFPDLGLFGYSFGYPVDLDRDGDLDLAGMDPGNHYWVAYQKKPYLPRGR
jgi:hypothetical protein